MSYTVRNRLRGYCNRAVGEATGQENAMPASYTDSGGVRVFPYREPEAAFLSTAAAISSMTLSAGVVSVAAVAHGLVVGDTCYILGAAQLRYRGPWKVTAVADVDNFQFQMPYTAGSPATGSPTAQKTIS